MLSNMQREEEAVIDASNLSSFELNQMILDEVRKGRRRIRVLNVLGHRFIGANIAALAPEGTTITLIGTVGDCLANFNQRINFIVQGNCGDDLADTMHGGRVIVYGDVRDVAAQALQGGVVFVRGSVGNRAGIQMREYLDRRPYFIIGGGADDYLGEYMAGGVIIILGLTRSSRRRVVGNYIASGLVGGRIYIRSRVDDSTIGVQPPKEDIQLYLSSLVEEGVLEQSTYLKIVSKTDFSYYRLREELPTPAFERIRRFYTAAHAEPPSSEYRELNTEEERELGPILQDYVITFNLPHQTLEETLTSKYTIISSSR